MPDKPHVIVGTAGHIDHGKSALVRALTGTDPDTLPEEKQRGMTIELGFVFLDDPGYEKQIVFIDVPGHEKFIKTMAAGASHVDAVLFIIAADEGISVQTREHFDILRLLGVKLGAVALTKSDLVDEAALAGLTNTVRGFVNGSFLENAPIVPVSSVTGAGLDVLRGVLRDLGRRAAPRPDNGIFRMPIDRVFIIQGFGVVVAGTVLGGSVGPGDTLEIFPDGLQARVRGIQVHGQKRDGSGIGQRTALNLQDVRKDDLRRGQVAGAAGSLVPTMRLDARLDVLRDAAKEVKHRDRVRLHIGTDEVIARLALLEGPKIAPGASSLVQLVLEAPTVALPGDRFVIRSFSPLVTVGGGVVLDARPEKHKRFSGKVLEGIAKLGGEVEDAVEQAFLQSEGRPSGVRDVALKLGRGEAEVSEAVRSLVEAGKLVPISADAPATYLPRPIYDRQAERAAEEVRAYFKAHPDLPLMPYADLRAGFLKGGDAPTLKLVVDDLVRAGVIFRKETQVGLVGHEAKVKPAHQELAEKIEALFWRARFAAPLEEEVQTKLGVNLNLFRAAVERLVRDGKLVRLAPKVTYHKATLDQAQETVTGLIALHGSVTIASLRDRLSLSRKYAQAILEYFDKIGLTKRVEDRHVLRQKSG